MNCIQNSLKASATEAVQLPGDLGRDHIRTFWCRDVGSTLHWNHFPVWCEHKISGFDPTLTMWIRCGSKLPDWGSFDPRRWVKFHNVNAICGFDPHQLHIYRKQDPVDPLWHIPWDTSMERNELYLLGIDFMTLAR